MQCLPGCLPGISTRIGIAIVGEQANTAAATIATPSSMIDICQPGQAIAASQIARPTTIIPMRVVLSVTLGSRSV